MHKSILFVCLGNICRSPAAEGVFINRIQSLGIEDRFEVDSAGTAGWHVGIQADKRMREAALKRGVEINSRARQIHMDDFKKFDLILTMDNSNLQDVNYLLSEAGDQAKSIIRPLLSYAKNQTCLEVPDPYYGGQNGFEEVLDLIDDAIDALLEKLTSEE